MKESFFSKLRRWWAEYRQARRTKRFVEGYRFARRCLRQKLMSAADLQDHVEVSRAYGEYDGYDEGIEQALYDADMEAGPDPWPVPHAHWKV